MVKCNVYQRAMSKIIKSRIYPLPCGRTYTGDKRTVDKLAKIHATMCDVCKGLPIMKCGTICGSDGGKLPKQRELDRKETSAIMPVSAHCVSNKRFSTSLSVTDLIGSHDELKRKLSAATVLKGLTNGE